jgi:GNAT superfamily N-acetyltransferase
MTQTTPGHEPASHVLTRKAPRHTPAASQLLTCVISLELKPDDRQALLDLFARSSPESRRDRFHHALSVFPQRYLDEIISGSQLALVARDTCHPERHGQVVGLASAAPIGPGTAEFAVWVEDSWQRHGVGSLLVRAILQLLADRGFDTAVGIAEPGNGAVRRLIQRVALHAVSRAEDGVIIISVPLPIDSADPTNRGVHPMAAGVGVPAG